MSSSPGANVMSKHFALAAVSDTREEPADDVDYAEYFEGASLPYLDWLGQRIDALDDVVRPAVSSGLPLMSLLELHPGAEGEEWSVELPTEGPEGGMTLTMSGRSTQALETKQLIGLKRMLERQVSRHAGDAGDALVELTAPPVLERPFYLRVSAGPQRFHARHAGALQPLLDQVLGKLAPRLAASPLRLLQPSDDVRHGIDDCWYLDVESGWIRVGVVLKARDYHVAHRAVQRELEAALATLTT